MRYMNAVGAVDLVSTAKVLNRLAKVAYGSHLHKRLSKLHNNALYGGEYDKLEVALNNLKKSVFAPLLNKNAQTAKKWAKRKNIYCNGHRKLITWSKLMKEYASLSL